MPECKSRMKALPGGRMKSKYHRFFIVVAAVGLWLGTHGRAYSQTALAEITGEVTDPTGAPVALVAITLTNTATGIKATLNSNEVGRFYVRSVAPGVYDIEAAKSGFKTFRANRVEIGTGQVLRYDIALEVGD